MHVYECVISDFCKYVEATTNGLTKLDPFITNDIMYGQPNGGSASGWDQSQFDQMVKLKQQFLESRTEAAKRNEINRLLEEAAHRKRQQQRAGMDARASDEADRRYADIAATYNATNKWADVDFVAGPSSIYYNGEQQSSTPGTIHSTAIGEWRRPEAVIATELEGQPNLKPEEKSPAIQIDGYKLGDLVQGGIGDCYFIAALCLMTIREPKRLTEIIKVDKVGKASSDTGAYLIRFYRQGKPVKVLIDDQLPCAPNGRLAFSRSTNPRELWPALMEKAYAKFYGCYEALEAGKVHHALQDLTNGFGEEILMKVTNSSLYLLCRKRYFIHVGFE
jgi:hypothetical protein